MSGERIDEIFDIDAINKQVSEVIKKIESVTTAMENSVEKIAACNGEIASSKTFDELTKATGKFIKVNNEYVYQTKEMAKLKQTEAQLNQRLQESYVEVARKVEKVRQEVAEEAKSIKESVKAQREKEKADKASSQSINEVIAQLKRQRDSVSELTAENRRLRDLVKSMDYNTQKAEIEQVNTVIDANTALIELNSDAYVKQKMNIGNYKSAVEGLDSIMNSLQGEMKRVADAGGSNSEEFKKLNAEFEKARAKSEEFARKMQELVGQSGSLKAELREVKEQMEQMSLDGDLGSDKYLELRDRAVELTQAINGVNDQIKNLEPPTATFDAIMSGLNGLAGGFQTFQGVLGFCNLESEDFERIQAKVQSAIAITNGLTAVKAALDKDSALMVGLNNAVQSKNIVISKAAAVAQKALNAAMLANPIFLLVTGILAGVAALSAWLASTKEISAEQKRQNEIHDKAIDNYAKEKTEIEGLASKIREGNTTREDQARVVAILTEKYGENYTKGKSMQQMEQDFVNNADAFVEAVQKRAEAQAAFELAVEAQKKALEAGTKGVKEYVGWWGRLFRTEEAEAELAEKRRKKEVTEQEALSQKYLEIQGQKQQVAEAAMKKSGELTEREKKDGEKSLKAKQQSDLMRVKSDADAQNQILSNTKSSYKEKVAALDAYTKKQIEAIRLQRDAELKGTTNKDERALIAEKAENDILKIRKQGVDVRKKLDEQEAQTLRQIEDVRSQVVMDASQRILDDDKVTYAQKIAAQYEFEQAQKESVKRQAQTEMQGLDISSSQFKLIKEKLEADLTNIEAQGKKDRERLENEETGKRIAKANAWSEAKVMDLERMQDRELLVLSKKYAKGKMSEEAYGKAKLAISAKYNQMIFDVEMSAMEAIANMLPEKEKGEVLKKIKEKQLEFTKQCNVLEITDNEKKKMTIEEQEKLMKDMKVQLAQETYDAVFSITNSMFERKIQQVDEEIEKVDEQKEHDLEVVEEMNISDEEKAERKKVIEEKAELDKEKLEKKKKKLQLQQAKADKANAMIQVAIDTAAGMVHLWRDPGGLAAIPFMAVLGAISAVQLATIAAQPLPKYAQGTEDHLGGWAIVGDGGKEEFVRTPTGDCFITPDKPTLVNLPKHSEVMPDFNLALNSVSFTPLIKENPPVYDFVRLEKKLNDFQKIFVETIVNNRPQLNLNLDKNGLWSTYEKHKGRTTYINERLNIQE